jgi:hypothetical protein
VSNDEKPSSPIDHEKELAEMRAASQRRQEHLRWLKKRASKIDDQDLRQMCETLLAKPELLFQQQIGYRYWLGWYDRVLLRFLDLVPEKRRTGRQVAAKVDYFVETGQAETRTEARRFVADLFGVSEDAVTKAHRRYGRFGGQKGRKLDGDKRH